MDYPDYGQSSGVFPGTCMQSSLSFTPVASNAVLLGLLMSVSFAKIASSLPAYSSSCVAVSGPVWLNGVKGESGSSVTPASPGGPSCAYAVFKYGVFNKIADNVNIVDSIPTTVAFLFIIPRWNGNTT